MTRSTAHTITIRLYQDGKTPHQVYALLRAMPEHAPLTDADLAEIVAAEYLARMTTEAIYRAVA